MSISYAPLWTYKAKTKPPISSLSDRDLAPVSRSFFMTVDKVMFNI
jgi:hypothetical protein